MIEVLGRFQRYAPVSETKVAFADAHGVLFIENEDQDDWYDLCQTYEGAVGWFLIISDAGKVCGASQDPTTLFPVDRTVLFTETLSQEFIDAIDDMRVLYKDGELVDPLSTPEGAARQTQTELTRAIQKHLDETARERNYDGILSLCTYATSANPKFRTEGQAGVEWRDEVWAACYAILDEVLAGTRRVPTGEGLLAELPAFTWPV